MNNAVFHHAKQSISRTSRTAKLIIQNSAVHLCQIFSFLKKDNYNNEITIKKKKKNFHIIIKYELRNTRKYNKIIINAYLIFFKKFKTLTVFCLKM